MPPGTMPRYPQSLILATALVWSSSCTLEVRRALALALGVEWDSVTELQATLHMHLEQTGVDVVTETTLAAISARSDSTTRRFTQPSPSGQR